VNAPDAPINLICLGMGAALIGAIVAFVGAMIHNAQQLRAKVDENLRDTRTKLYKPLWTLTQLVPRWSKPHTLTCAQMAQFSQTLNAWYYSDGGIYMSLPARRAYSHLQHALEPFVDMQGAGAKTLENKEYNFIAKRCGRLRWELSKDIISRSRILWTP
jgi:hypothetical protein